MSPSDSPMTRTEALLCLLVLHNMRGDSQAEKTIALDRAGFSASEIAQLLGIAPAGVTQNLYMARKAAKKGKKAPVKGVVKKKSPARSVKKASPRVAKAKGK